MKNLLIIILIFIGINPSTLWSQKLDKGLIAHYLFNGGTLDETTYSNNGNANGNVSFGLDRFGNKCGAIYLDGSTGYVSVPDSRSLSSPSKSFSVVTWFKIDKSQAPNFKWLSVVCKSDNSVETKDSPHYRCQITSKTVSINTEFTEKNITFMNADVWYHYALVYDGNNVQVYLDGVKYWSYPYNNKLTSNNQPLEIGRDKPGNLEYFFGAFDDLRIYNRALDDSEVSALFKDDSEKTSPKPCNKPNPPTPPVDTTTTTTTKPNPTTPTVTNPVAGKIKYKKTIEVQSESIRLVCYDHQKQDGDTVSLIINDIIIVHKERLNARNNNPITHNLYLVPNQEYTLISKAWNLGKIPPNTMTMEIHDGSTHPQVVVLTSEIGLSEAIKLIYKTQ